ncbi:MAG: hypothetical protein AAGH76_10090 [Pseudomonadota bacterium]
MKIRLRGNSIRLRLTRSEVDVIGHGESVSERTVFPNGAVLATTLTASDGSKLCVEFRDAELIVTAPAAALNRWALGDAVGLDDLASPDNFTVVVEKDFSCLSPRAGGDDDDTFPHPEAGSGRC